MGRYDIEELIQQHVIFTKTCTSGWNKLKCPICNDYKSRGGIKYESGNILYNCFNCGFKAVYNGDDFKVSGKMRKLLNALNIPDDDINEVIGQKYFDANGEKLHTEQKAKGIDLSTPQIELPPKSYKLSSAPDDDIWKTIAIEYLKSRSLNVSSCEWYLSSDDEYRDRLIIPFFRRGKLIYWQARSFDPSSKTKYINAETPKENVIYGYDTLMDYDVKTVFVTEGVFDPITVGGISIIGSVLPKNKIEILNKYKKDYIFVIDKDKNGYQLGKAAIANGWKIAFLSGETEDINHAVTRFGKIWTINDIMSNVISGFQAEVYLETYCKR